MNLSSVVEWWKRRSWLERGLVIGVILFLYGLGSIIQYAEDREIVQQQAAEQAELNRINTEANSLFDSLGQSSGYRPKIDQWGQKPTLFILTSSWSSLNSEQQQMIKDWGDQTYGNGQFQIMLGDRVTSPGVISVDRQIYP
ncbi:hypothetical protein [Spirulina major]|uniref:hypothetical protein n=1 Tax=Spirulina major TaxID=270636 RepID=UPI000932DEC2|nr:hypothetical protein [Spirulina major]